MGNNSNSIPAHRVQAHDVPPCRLIPWPIAVHWFTNGWLLPTIYPQTESPYCPGSHLRLVGYKDIPVDVDAEGNLCAFPPPELSTGPLLLDPGSGKPHNVILGVLNGDSGTTTCVFAEGSTIDEAFTGVLHALVHLFMDEVRDPEVIDEFARFAIEHFPNILDQQEALHRLIEAL